MSAATWALAGSITFALVVVLAWRYLEERMRTLARQHADEALADYKHRYDALLEQLKTERQGRLQEFGLFTQRQHTVYPRLYARYRIASDWYGATSGLTMVPDFEELDAHEARRYLLALGQDLDSPALARILRQYEAGENKAGGAALEDVMWAHRLSRASAAFTRAVNYEALQEPYLSDSVRGVVALARLRIAEYSVRVHHKEPNDRAMYDRKSAMESAVAELLQAVSTELRRGQVALLASAGE